MTARYKPGFYVILLVILMASVPSINAMATTVAIPETTLPAGSYATLSVTIHDMQDYGTGTIGISFDPAVVHVTSVTSGPHSTVVDWNHDNSSGTVIISAWNIDGVSGDFIFANVTFLAVGTGSTPLNLTVTTLKDIYYETIPTRTENGSYSFKSSLFDTGTGTYPSIAGTHYGCFTPKRNITVRQIYTYPCAGTGGHSESVIFCDYETGEIEIDVSCDGYQDDYHNITISPPVELLKDRVYNYTIRTWSYPQVIHQTELETDDGTINCTNFIDINRRWYNDWIPAITLF